jgi:hypothetical protein
VEWIEIFIVSVYAAELSGHLWEPGEGNHSEYRPIWIAAAAVIGAIATAGLVLPTWPKKGMVIAIAALGFVALFPFIRPPHFRFPKLTEALVSLVVHSPAQALLLGISLIIIFVLIAILKLGSRRPDS